MSMSSQYAIRSELFYPRYWAMVFDLLESQAAAYAAEEAAREAQEQEDSAELAA
ncbi:hypothetical protein G6O69_00395 [Pseudenhygromyxa sp. WMMC2535]|uniref:hypothetical protein n=1 Tax=Pseudenhygromyxa sp. WMMC2535 TaxID=2712867 RepID=UPI001557D834|nr:hypothetical protein [Pseudenhygromyxa sp. WMMC2535]NVB36269.1 hypothetical protein [Pseudenhygromyxa sp. WMMC2535]